jgi:hypothetical protein
VVEPWSGVRRASFTCARARSLARSPHTTVFAPWLVQVGIKPLVGSELIICWLCLCKLGIRLVLERSRGLGQEPRAAGPTDDSVAGIGKGLVCSSRILSLERDLFGEQRGGRGPHLGGLDVYAEHADLDPGCKHAGQPWLTHSGGDGDENGIHERQYHGACSTDCTRPAHRRHSSGEASSGGRHGRGQPHRSTAISGCFVATGSGLIIVTRNTA